MDFSEEDHKEIQARFREHREHLMKAMREIVAKNSADLEQQWQRWNVENIELERIVNLPSPK